MFDTRRKDALLPQMASNNQSRSLHGANYRETIDLGCSCGKNSTCAQGRAVVEDNVQTSLLLHNDNIEILWAGHDHNRQRTSSRQADD